ncbi:MAG: radical SAM protein [Clostridiales bacterium]|nr:radical SAM protein [Clostridiales bacterium]
MPEREGPLYPLITLSRHRMETDGEGVTTLIAGAGCPLRCGYCINRKLLEKDAERVTPRELYDRLKVDDLYFRATGGGVTFGGGESLLHAGFIRAFRGICGDAWRIWAETSLAVPEELVRTAAECVDHFIVDIKTLDREIYRAYTGGDMELALNNLLLLKELAGPERILVRIPLIPAYNTRADQEHARALLAEKGFSQFDLFDYVVR